MQGLLLIAAIAFSPKAPNPVGVWIGGVNTDNVPVARRKAIKNWYDQSQAEITFKPDHTYRMQTTYHIAGKTSRQVSEGTWNQNLLTLTLNWKISEKIAEPSSRKSEYEFSKDGKTFSHPLTEGAALLYKRKK